MSVEPIAGPWSAERFQLFRVLVSQTALALERCRLADEVHAARSLADTERSRNALLSSVSHDLRTPLATITGAATSLRDGTAQLADATRRDLADMIAEEAQRLNRLIGNILDMTRLESGMLQIRRDWHSLEELVGAALVRLEATLGSRPVVLDLPPDLPLVSLDGVLFEQVLTNLIENAHKYSADGLPIEIRADIAGTALRLEVADRGPGLPPGEETHVFEKFHRGSNTRAVTGAGLGLAICQGIVEAHGGTISAANRDGGGATFTVRLPLEGVPPIVEQERGASAAAGAS
jgi:two-component system sensor histidine kinase KdpD